MSWTKIMMSWPLFQNTLILRRPGVAIFVDIIKTVTMFVKTITKALRKVNTKPAQNLYHTVQNKLFNNSCKERSDDCSDDPTYQSPMERRREATNESVAKLFLSPLKTGYDRDKISYGKKIDQVFNTSSEMTVSVLDVSVKDLVPSLSFYKETCCQKSFRSWQINRIHHRKIDW